MTCIVPNAGSTDSLRTVLDAPQLRDDFYCSLLAYSRVTQCLAVGLGNFVHLWTEKSGVDTPSAANTPATSHVTSLSFSSADGAQAILATGRADGRISLWSTLDEAPRFEAAHPSPVSCVSFRPNVTKKPSLRDNITPVDTEELLVGDELGNIYLYSIEWPNETERDIFNWNGDISLLARLTFHTQQICGIAWSPSGDMFASGGNDNACFLFERRKTLRAHSSTLTSFLPEPESIHVSSGLRSSIRQVITPGQGSVLNIGLGRHKHRWQLNAAIKAIAFCPWQSGLIALGGGSNDRCIHFFHTVSGAALAVIDCSAQVTSLVWSTTRREIAATFGFAQPEHPYRIAVFAWPSCEQVAAIPWFDESRALYAIPFPGGPLTRDVARGDGVLDGMRKEEGCLVVAASDAAIRFHEVWPEERGGKRKNGIGILGGSDILEALHGTENEDAGGIIR